ncbi:HD-GYP domain-containing protein [Acidovorax sp. Be4]|uniref:HD-GYP domain-containing protein n=1 Tax=Acidovorax bellezanensis TaxID=2976702 RepID=A0ABT2PJA8_9BURK|nr:HD-GYP domain-containing protein [Acidovorax sp. Be4]MCT9810566.1 HD-GYP domain-containing protein [Acidovorax sp. Be4]
MLKRLNVQHLSQGMYLHEFCGSWMDHPFWRTRFLINTPEDLAKLHSGFIQEVWIDARKGLDVPAGVPCVVYDPDAEAFADQSPKPTERPRSALGTTGSSMGAELHHAASLCQRAHPAITQLFSNARDGEAVDIHTVYRLVEDITDSIERNPSALPSLVRLKNADQYTYLHCLAVSALMGALARRLGLDDHSVRKAALAGLLHDLGKASISPAVLNKPGPLDAKEFAHIRTHPERGWQMLQAMDIDPAVREACLYHHEKIDGTGYPHKLEGDNIPLLARMTAICDIYDAVTSDRPYKRGWPPAEAVRRMAQWSRNHLDRKLFEAFVQTVGIYPVGSLVRLQSEQLAVVIEPSGVSLLAPRVKVFYAIKPQQRITPEILDLSAFSCHDRIVTHEDPADWPFDDVDLLWRGTAASPASAAAAAAAVA